MKSLNNKRDNYITSQESTIIQNSIHQINEGTTSSFWSPGYFALLFCTGIALILVIFYIYIIRPYVTLPADILMWEETNYVGDIIKIRNGVPIYTNPTDNNSGIYTPASQIITYAISYIIGKPTSIVTWRIIQLIYTTLASLLATLCCILLYQIANPGTRIPFPKTWIICFFLTLFLASTSPRVNAFTHCLHLDALSLFISILSFWAILCYIKSPNLKRTILMAVCPAIGYLTKQFLISWSAVMFVFLFLHNPKNIKRQAFFIISTTSFIAIAIGFCYLLWGDNFIFWTFEIMGGSRNKITFSTAGFHVSVPRIVDHIIRAWTEIGIGIIGGLMILRDSNIRKLAPVFIAWIVLILFEGFTSGAGWGVLYHFGPGVVIGTILLLSALPRIWPIEKRITDSEFQNLLYWTRPLGYAIGLFCVFLALHVVPTADKNEGRYYARRPSPDIYRYISDIEREFNGYHPNEVLLDIGNWIYLRHSVIAKDRAISLADQPPGGIYKNIEVMVKRINQKVYKKILVRDFYSPFFLYDWANWPKSSGVRDAILKNYIEQRIIPASKGNTLGSPSIRHTGPISVFLPKISVNIESNR